MESNPIGTVLVVDDTETNIDILVETLGDDYDVQVAMDGETALASVAEDPPDLILLDIMMPEMDGYEVCRRLKADDKTRDIPVIFVTAKTEVEDEVRGFKLGAVDYITKPISPPRVLERIRTHLLLRETQRDLAAKNARLEETARLREDVDLIMRHDLKGPLASIIGLADAIRGAGNIDADHAASLAAISASGYRLLNMINLSLDLMKMERGEYPLNPVSVEMIGLFRKIVEDAKSLAETKRITTRLRVNGAAPDSGSGFWMVGEELLCYSMFSNLIRNAVEAAPEATVVAVDLEGRPGAAGSVRVHNTGAVPEVIRERFFDKYATAGKMSGTGLGTYSAKLIAETQNGQIAMMTSASAGTVITVTLPVAHPPVVNEGTGADAVKLMADRGAPRFSGLDVLLVDDDPFNLLVLCKFLADTGLRIDTAENGWVALRKIESSRFHLVFMDMEMPVLNGLETIARIRRLESAATHGADPIIAIALSAHDDATIRLRCRDAGFDAYLRKPVGRKDLVDAVRRFFSDDDAVVSGLEAAPTTDMSSPPAMSACPVQIDADLKDLMPGFLDAKAQDLAKLRQRLDNGDYEAVRQISHKLKGAFNMYGFRFLSDACAEVERAAPAPEKARIEEKLAAIERHFENMEIRFVHDE